MEENSGAGGFFPRLWADSRRRVIAVAVAALLAVGIVFALIASPQLLAANSQPGGGSPAATATATVTATSSAEPSAVPESSASPAPPPTSDPPSDPAAGTPKAAAPDAAAPVHLTYDDAAIDLPVLPLTPSQAELATQSLVPPLTMDAYWLTVYGKPGEGSENTTYITGHSWEDREAPFNRLSSAAEVGDTLELTTGTGVLEYVVESVTTHDKNTLKNSDIWDIVPNRLVLISCYTEDLWGKNVVVVASPAP